MTYAQDSPVIAFYDNEFKGVSSEEFAKFKAVYAIPSDTNYQKQFVLNILKPDVTIIDGVYYTFDKYNFWEGKFKEYKHYYNDGKSLYKTIEGDSVSSIVTTYNSDGKMELHYQLKDGKLHGDKYSFFNDNRDGYVVYHYDNGNRIGNMDYIESGVHTEYTLPKDGSRGQLIMQDVDLSDRMEDVDKSGTKWQKYLKNGLLIQSSCIKGNEYGSYWTIQFIMTNFGRDWVQLDPDSLIIIGKKDGAVIPLERIPLKTYMKKVNRKHNKELFWMGFMEGVVNADAGKYTSTSRLSVGNKTYRIESTYIDEKERQEINRAMQKRLDDYSKRLMEEQGAIADNYFRKKPLNPNEPELCVQCIKMTECDEFHIELIISGKTYIFDLSTK